MLDLCCGGGVAFPPSSGSRTRRARQISPPVWIAFEIHWHPRETWSPFVPEKVRTIDRDEKEPNGEFLLFRGMRGEASPDGRGDERMSASFRFPSGTDATVNQRNVLDRFHRNALVSTTPSIRHLCSLDSGIQQSRADDSVQTDHPVDGNP